MIALIMGLSVSLSDSVSGNASEQLKSQATEEIKDIIQETKRLELTEQACQALFFISLDADSSMKIYQEGSGAMLLDDPAGCLIDALIDEIIEPEPGETDTVCKYRLYSDIRLVDVETGKVLSGFKADANAAANSYSMAKELAWLEWRQQVEDGIRDMFRLKPVVLRVSGPLWWKRVKLSVGKDQGVQEGHVYSVWRKYDVDARRKLGLVVVDEVHNTYCWARVIQGSYQIRENDLAYEDVYPRTVFGVVRVLPRAGSAYSYYNGVLDQNLGPARNLFFGIAPWRTGLLSPELGLEFTKHASAWGLESWLWANTGLDPIPEVLGLEAGAGLGFTWHYQPIVEGVDLTGDPDGAHAFGLGLAVRAGPRLFFGPDFSVDASVGWRTGFQTPWLYRAETTVSDTSGTTETQTKWFTVPDRFLENGDLRLMGPVISLGFRFRI